MSAKQHTDGQSDASTCSASSDTPETDEAFAESLRVSGTVGLTNHFFSRMAKLDRQRNAAWQTLKEIRELFTADESFGATVEALFAKPLEEAEAEIARLQSLLNVKSVPPERSAPDA